MEDLGIDGRMMGEYISKEQFDVMWITLDLLRTGVLYSKLSNVCKSCFA